MRGIIPATAKECHFKELARSRYFITTRLAHAERKIGSESFRSHGSFCLLTFSEKLRKKIDSPTLSR